MIRLFLGLAACMALALLFDNSAGLTSGAHAALVLGFVLIFSYYIGNRLITNLGIPSITGYILVGIVFGPYGLGLVYDRLLLINHQATDYFEIVDAAALGLIALTAGGELKFKLLRGKVSTIGATIGMHIGLGIAFAALGLLTMYYIYPPLAEYSGGELWSAILLVAAVGLANSPAASLAVIQEFGRWNELGRMVIAVTVAKDVVVISMFSIAMFIVAKLLATDTDQHGLALLLWEISGSVLIGLVIGGAILLYLRYISAEFSLFILCLGFVAVLFLPLLHLSGILACMVAGCLIENTSSQGPKLILAIERHSIPIYIIFFTMAGAELNLNAIYQTWPLMLVIVALRCLSIFLGTTLAGKLTAANSEYTRLGWTGFLAQAGISIGLTSVVIKEVPQIGSSIGLCLLAAIAVNQIIGPVLFRLALNKTITTDEAATSTTPTAAHTK